MLSMQSADRRSRIKSGPSGFQPLLFNMGPQTTRGSVMPREEDSVTTMIQQQKMNKQIYN